MIFIHVQQELIQISRGWQLANGNRGDFMRNFALQNFPFLEDDFDAMTDYELFCKMVEYMKKMSIQFDEFQKKLNIYENYFNNLDVQNEIDNKLDEMYQSGELASLVSEFLALKSTYTYNTVAEMKLAENLVDGCYTKTLGYNELNDGGGSYYYIREKEDDESADEIFTIALYDPDLIAELLVHNNEMNVKQGGLTGDVSDDATDILTELFASDYDLYFPTGTYNFDTSMVLNNNIRGDGTNKSILKFTAENNAALFTSNNLVNLKIDGLCFDCGNLTDDVKTAFSLYDTSGLSITNCEFKNGYGSFFRLNGSDNIVIENCYFHDIAGDESNMGNCIYCHPVTNMLINNCKCYNVMEDFLYLDGDDTHIVKNVIVSNCYLHHTSHDNEYLVSNCIGINGYCDNVTVNNCILTNNGAGIRCQGRYGFTPTNIFIYDNRISDNIQNGLNITANGIVISNNIIYNNPQDGVYILSSNDVTFSHNIVHNSGRNGVWCRSSNYLTIDGNRIYDNVTCGLGLGTASGYDCNNVTISNCDIYKTDTGTQGTGIQMLYGDNVKVLSCHVYGNVVDWDMHRSGVTNYISQLNPAYQQSTVKSLIYGSAIPSNGTYNKGDIILYTSPSAGGYIGAVCVTAGTPGTWKQFGSISS